MQPHSTSILGHDGTPQFDSDPSRAPSSRAVVQQVFGRRDRTPWPVLWLSLLWVFAESPMALRLIAIELGSKDPTGDGIIGAVLGGSAIACGTLWIWYAILGSMANTSRWQMLVGCCAGMALVHVFASPMIQTVVAVFTWAMLGTTGVSLAVRYLLGITLNREHAEQKSDLTIWMLLRYMVAAAVLAWFTRSIGSDESIPLTPPQVVMFGIVAGIVSGLVSFIVLAAMSQRWRWVYLGLMLVLVLPLSAGATIYISQQFPSLQLTIVAIVAAYLSLAAHLILFSLPLIAYGLAFVPRSRASVHAAAKTS